MCIRDRVHAEKLDVAAVVLTGADAVELFIVQRHPAFPAFTVLENPVFKSIFYHPLLGLCFFGGRTIELMPVSYTHLDVYKRQRQNPAIRCRIRSGR